MNEKSSVGKLKGIGEKTVARCAGAGVKMVGDLIRYYPRGYDIFDDPVPIGELEEGKTAAVTGAVFGRIQVSGNQRMQITTLHLKDHTGTLKVI